jgi:DNA repair exonuclease SbcCD ATPase subunit
MCPFPASELQSWLTNEPLQVQLDLDTPSGPVTILRGKKNSLKVAGRTVTSAKAISDEIRKIFGLDPETLRAITYRAQNTKGLFLSLTDAEKKEFLGRLLGLSSIETAVESAETRIRELKPSVEAMEAALSLNKQELSVLEAQKIPDPESDSSLLEEERQLLIEQQTLEQQEAAALAQIQGQYNQTQEDPELVELGNYLQVAKSQLESLLKVQQQREEQFRIHQEGLRKKLQDIIQRDTMLSHYRGDLEKQRVQLSKLVAGHCPTCNREWEQASSKAAALELQIQNLEATIGSLTKQQRDRQQLETELKVRFQPDPNVEKLKDLRIQLESQLKTKTQSRLNSSTESLRAQLGIIQAESKAVKSRLSGVAQQIKSVNQLNLKLQEAREFAQRNLNTLKDKIATTEATLQKQLRELDAERDFVGLLGREGFLSVIFDDVLREIESETNERLSRLANVRHVTVQFRTEMVTQKGSVKRVITPVASVGGHETKLGPGLSGGMFSSVDAQVELAVMSVVQRRTGVLPGFLCLDEIFEGQGRPTREAAIEVLRDYAATKLILVIAHDSEFKESFEQRTIVVTYENGRSRIEQ